MINYIRRNATITILCIESAMMMMGMGLVAPVLPQYARSFGVSVAMVGLTITAFGVARIFGDIPTGRIADRFGRRPILIIGPLIIAAGSVACGLATEFWQLLVFRLVQGMGSALYTTAAMIMTADISTKDNRGQMLGMYQGSLLIGTGLGPTIGGFIAQYTGSLQMPFFAYSILGVGASVWAYFQLKETKPPASTAAPAAVAAKSGHGWGGFAEFLGNPSFVLVSAVTMGVFFLRSASLNQIVPLLANDRFSATAGQIGLALTMSGMVNLVTLQIAGRVSDRFGRKLVMVPGCLIMAAFTVLLAMTQNYGFLLFTCVFSGIGLGMTATSAAAYVTDIVPRESYSRAISVYRTIGDSGMVVGPVLLGWLTDIRGYSFALYFNFSFLVLTAAAFWFLAKEAPRVKKGNQTTGHVGYSR